MPPSRRLFVEASVGLAGLGTAYASPPRAAVDPAFEPAYLKLHRTGELRRRADALWAMLESCRLCPRECGAARLRGEKGFCHASRDVEVSSHHPHFGEERSLVGRGGSGTVFLTNCNLRCVFCINWEVSQGGQGWRKTLDDLADMMLDLQRRGCHNVNVVTPTHYSAHVVRALDLAAGRGLRLPVVYNTCGWERLEVLKQLDGVVDIYLPDFKYWDGKKAAKYSSGAETYPEVTREGDPGDAPAGGRRPSRRRRAHVPRAHDPAPRDAERRGGDEGDPRLDRVEPAQGHLRQRHVAVPARCTAPPSSPRSPGPSRGRSTRTRSPAPAASASPTSTSRAGAARNHR